MSISAVSYDNLSHRKRRRGNRVLCALIACGLGAVVIIPIAVDVMNSPGDVEPPWKLLPPDPEAVAEQNRRIAKGKRIVDEFVTKVRAQPADSPGNPQANRIRRMKKIGEFEFIGEGDAHMRFGCNGESEDGKPVRLEIDVDVGRIWWVDFVGITELSKE